MEQEPMEREPMEREPMEREPMEREAMEREPVEQETMEPVSYTHLDVYKRQGRGHGRETRSSLRKNISQGVIIMIHVAVMGYGTIGSGAVSYTHLKLLPDLVEQNPALFHVAHIAHVGEAGNLIRFQLFFGLQEPLLAVKAVDCLLYTSRCV